jgi:hypothetical protein
VQLHALFHIVHEHPALDHVLLYLDLVGSVVVPLDLEVPVVVVVLETD